MKHIFQRSMLLALCCACTFAAFPQNTGTTVFSGGGNNLEDQVNAQHSECLTHAQRAAVNAQVAVNVQLLREQGVMSEDQPEMLVYFSWPLRLKAGLTDPSYYTIGGYVDENAGSGTLDYNCGSRTYDGHRGTDIGTFPFAWTKMANNDVEVVAAAPGIIVFRQDGYYDQNCSWNNQTGNAIIIQHSDGSRAWYWHMKQNSVTNKTVGSYVLSGEYLGVVGSSGISTGPHLHFEVDRGENQPLVDPWGGVCNYNGGQSWWSAQKPYYDPKIVKIMTHNAGPTMSQCPGGENMNASNTFQPGQLAYFAGYFRDYLPQTNATYVVRRPDGVVWNTWTVSNVNNYLNQAYWYWAAYLPSTGPNGTWSFQVTYQGQAVTHYFTVGSSTCNTPTGLFTSNITQTSAQLNWTAVSGAASYAIQYRLAGGTWYDLNGGPFTTNYVNVTGFQPGTAYEWRVRTNCTNGLSSAWSGGVAFTTLSATCNTPTGLYTSNIAQTSARFNWNVVNGAASYTVQYRLAGGAWYTVGPVTTNYTTVTGLQPGTAYEWRVRTNCTNGLSSAWSGGVAFTTLSAGCGMPTGLYASDVTQNTATLNWNIVPGAQSYNVQFFLNGSWVNLGSGGFTSNSVGVYGLYANTTYQWRVIANCSGSQSSPSASSYFSTPTVPNCTNGYQYPAYALTPASYWQYQTQVWGGEYCLMNVQAGQIYTFSYCSSDGGYLAFDGEISIRTTSNQLIAYADDICGYAPRIVWQAGFTGQVRVLLTKFQCLAQSTNSTLAYRIGSSFFNGRADERDAATETPFIRLEQPDILFEDDATADTPASENAAQKTETEKTPSDRSAVAAASSLLVFPNPASERFAIRCENTDAETAVEIRVFDQMGRLQWSQTQTLQPGLNEWEVPALDWPNGMYLLHLSTDDGRLFNGKVQILK